MVVSIISAEGLNDFPKAYGGVWAEFYQENKITFRYLAQTYKLCKKKETLPTKAAFGWNIWAWLQGHSIDFSESWDVGKISSFRQW